MLKAELSPVFPHLFQQSIDTHDILKKWSLTNICPLDQSPTSLTCVPFKMLDYKNVQISWLISVNIIICRTGSMVFEEKKILRCEFQLTTVKFNKFDNTGQVNIFIMEFKIHSSV